MKENENENDERHKEGMEGWGDTASVFLWLYWFIPFPLPNYFNGTQVTGDLFRWILMFEVQKKILNMRQRRCDNDAVRQNEHIFPIDHVVTSGIQQCTCP